MKHNKKNKNNKKKTNKRNYTEQINNVIVTN